MLRASIVTKLVDEGANVKTTYGSTEIGLPSVPSLTQEKIQNATGSQTCTLTAMLMEDLGDGLYECVVCNGFELAVELWDGPSDRKPSRTNDLFVQNPPHSGYFSLQGHRDDVLVHAGGENTNATPIESDIKGRCKLIKSLVMLGHGRIAGPHNGCQRTGLGDSRAIQQIISSTLVPYTFYDYILPESQILAVTPKGNVKRKEAERIYEGLIIELYASQEGQHRNMQKIQAISVERLAETIRKVVSQIFENPLTGAGDDTGLYILGIDSVLAISLKVELAKRVGRISLQASSTKPGSRWVNWSVTGWVNWSS